MTAPRRATLTEVRDVASAQGVDTMSSTQLARRQRVLDAVLELILAGADEDMQMKEIADRSSVALGTIYRYFSSKDHVLAAALVEWTRGLEQKITADPPARGSAADQLVAIFRWALRAYQRHPTFASVLIFVANSPDPNASACYREMGPVVFATFDPPEVDDETREQVLALVGALWYHELVEWTNERRTISEVQASLERAARFLLPDGS
jgi:TetR/AcrR family transcriptional regulator, cholesterol catabolism regulator